MFHSECPLYLIGQIFTKRPSLNSFFLLSRNSRNLVTSTCQKINFNKTDTGSWVCGDRVSIDRLTDRNSDRYISR